ncbi:MAG: hypothetical protein WCF84_07220 [Anaerolineae bacterium]
MSALEQRYQGKVKFIRINIDAPESRPYLDKYRVLGTPSIALVDRQGHIVSNVPGWPGEQQVTQALDSLVSRQ